MSQAAKKKTPGAAPATKAEPPKPAAEKKAAETPSLTTASSAESASKKSKVPAHLRALQKQQEELQRKREEEARLRAEAEARAQEAERLTAEEEQRKAEEKARKKQKEKARIEQLKNEGKYLTKAQKEEKARNEQKLQQMLASGLKVGPTGEKGEKEESKKPRPTQKVRHNKQADEEKRLAEAAERARLQAEAAIKEAEEAARLEKEKAEKEKALESDEDSIDEDWETAADGANKEDVKDSWDADTDEEESEEDDDDDDEEDEKGDKKASLQSDTQKTTSIPHRKGTAPSAQERKTGTTPSDGPSVGKEIGKAAQTSETQPEKIYAKQAAPTTNSSNNLRSPICCILGHVDTGKTKLLDKIRQTNIQEGEAGGITQQIGATFFPADAIKQKTAVVNKDNSFECKVPGLLIIDTPGHESFSNLRQRGSSLCNFAILVVDLMHGLEPQTLESMRILRDKKTPFIVALNKIDRLFGWKKIDNNGFQESLELQNKAVQNEFKNRLEQTKVAFAEQGFNSEVFYENRSLAKTVSLVPTSAHTGEGVPDLLKLIVKLTQERMVGALRYLSELSATVLEVKAIEGFGMTIDVILSNGILREGDKFKVCGTEGVITTNIRALLTPAPMKELRVKSNYIHNKEVKAAMGVKISAPNLEGAIAGSRLLTVGPDDDEDDLDDDLMEDLEALFSRVETTGRGVSVQASTLGSLEALLDFLKSCKIPVAHVGIGPVYKRDVMQCGIMLEKAADFAVMLCFDVKVDKEAQQYADDQGIEIITAEIIYHLFDAFQKRMDKLAEKKKEELKGLSIFPCVLNPIAVFNKTGPIVVGVDVIEGQLRIDTPIVAVHELNGVKNFITLGRVTSIEREHKAIQVCKKGQPSVAVKIEAGGSQPAYGRQLEDKDMLYSHISRQSIDCLKEFYRKDVSQDEWKLIVKLKSLLDVA